MEGVYNCSGQPILITPPLVFKRNAPELLLVCCQISSDDAASKVRDDFFARTSIKLTEWSIIPIKKKV